MLVIAGLKKRSKRNTDIMNTKEVQQKSFQDQSSFEKLNHSLLQLTQAPSKCSFPEILHYIAASVVKRTKYTPHSLGYYYLQI